MADAEPSIPFELDAQLTFDRVEVGLSVGTIRISTQADGSLEIASSGRLPGGSLRELRQAREGLQLLAQATQKGVSITHNGRQLAEMHSGLSTMPRLSIRWWSVLRSGIDKLTGQNAN